MKVRCEMLYSQNCLYKAYSISSHVDLNSLLRQVWQTNLLHVECAYVDHNGILELNLLWR